MTKEARIYNGENTAPSISGPGKSRQLHVKNEIRTLQILYAEYIIQNSRLDVLQVRIKIAGRNNLRYADDTTLMAESEEELKSLLMKVEEENEKAGSKLSIQKPKIMASSPSIHSKQKKKK